MEGPNEGADLVHYLDAVRKGSNQNADDHAQMVAHDLKQLQLQVLQGIDTSKKDFEGELAKAAPLSKRLSDMVVTDILQCRNQKEAARVAEFYLDVARKSVEAGDYQSADNIMSGLNNVTRRILPKELVQQASQQLIEISEQFRQYTKAGMLERDDSTTIPMVSNMSHKYADTKGAISNLREEYDDPSVGVTLQNGLISIKNTFTDLVNNIPSEPMQTNLAQKVTAPVLAPMRDDVIDAKDDPNSQEARSYKIKPQGQDSKVHFHSPSALKSHHDVKKHLNAQEPVALASLIPDPVPTQARLEKVQLTSEQERPKANPEKVMDLKHRLRAAQDRREQRQAAREQAAAEVSVPQREEPAPKTNPQKAMDLKQKLRVAQERREQRQAVREQAAAEAPVPPLSNKANLKKQSQAWQANLQKDREATKPTADSVAKGLDPIIADALAAHQQHQDSKPNSNPAAQAPQAAAPVQSQPVLRSALRDKTAADSRPARRVAFAEDLQAEPKPVLSAFSNFNAQRQDANKAKPALEATEDAPKVSPRTRT